MKSRLWPNEPSDYGYSLQVRSMSISLKNAGLMLMDSLALWRVPRARLEKGRRKVLIIRLDGFGDFILFTDAIGGLRDFFPRDNVEITLLGNELWKDLAFSSPDLDRTIFLNREMFLDNLAYRYRIMKDIRSEEFDVALNPVYSREAMLADAVVRLSRAPERIGWRGNLDNISPLASRMSGHWYTRLLEDDGTDLMELDRNAEFVRRVGLADFSPRLPKIDAVDSWTKEANTLLSKSGISNPFAVLLPGNGPPQERSWPAEKYADLIRYITSANGWQVVVCGGEQDRTLGRRILELVGEKMVMNLMGKTSLGEFAGIIYRSALVVGSDTGGIHLAAAIGIPSVSITGGGFPGRFLPYKLDNEEITVPSADGPEEVCPPTVVKSGKPCSCDNWLCHREEWKGGTFPCIDEIVVHEIIRAVRMIMERHKSRRDIKS